MASLPAIYTIEASDAPQQTDRLREILQNLETENRVRGFTVLGAEDELSSITDNMGEEDLILIVLSRQLEEHKKRIENRFKALKSRMPGVRVAEILVDNIVYDNEFITFPTDLRPIRNREDMDDAWSSIKMSLNDMFPAKKKQVQIDQPDPPPVKSYSNLEQLGQNYDLAILFLRIAVGVIFIAAGWGKLTGIEGTQEFFSAIGIPAASLMAFVVAIVEFFGGLMVLAGLYLRVPSLLLAFVMVIAIITVKLDQGFIAMRIDLALLMMSLALFILGSGKISFEHLLKR